MNFLVSHVTKQPPIKDQSGHTIPIQLSIKGQKKLLIIVYLPISKEACFSCGV
jgi:hypothetical protein